MVKKVKILPAIATLALGIAGLASTNNANAYVVQNGTGVNEVSLCHTLTDIVGSVDVNYTYTLTNSEAPGLSFTNVSIVNNTGTIGSKTADQLEVVMHFTADGSSTTATQCVDLDFSSAIDSAAEFGPKIVAVSEESSNEDSYPADSSSKDITFAYELSLDSNNLPIASGDDYKSLFTIVKSEPVFTSSANIAQTYITLTKQVRGNAASTAKEFEFLIKITKPAGVTDNFFDVWEEGSSTVRRCNYENLTNYNSGVTDCKVKLKHNQKAYIGCANCKTSSRTGTLYVGSDVTITETSYTLDGYTTSYQVTSNGVAGSETTGNSFRKQSIEEGDSVVFYNEKTFNPTGRFLVIFPFVILAIAAGVMIIVMRKSSENKKQA